MACVNQKRKNNIGSGGTSSMSNFFVKNKKKIMTRKGEKCKEIHHPYHLIWLQLNVQFVKKLSFKRQSDWLADYDFHTKNMEKIYTLFYKLQADMHISGTYQWLKDHIRQISADMVALHKSVYILENWVKKCSIYQTTNIVKGGDTIHT